MRLAISNIAWAPEHRLAVYGAMAARGVRGLEFAPGLLFAGEADPFDPSDEAEARVRGELGEAGLAIVSMQSLLFGVPDAALFGSPDQRRRFEAGLVRALYLAGRMGCPNVVMGSPKQRVIPDGMAAEAALDIACDVFRRLGDLAGSLGVAVALEPNPVVYETNFMTTLDETLSVVEAVDHPAVTLNFDVGSLLINGEFGELAELFGHAREHVSHVHLSEPQLAPAPRSPELAAEVLRVLAAGGYDRAVSIEMRSTDSDQVAAVEAALDRLMAGARGAIAA